MIKIISYVVFAVASALVVLGFMNATSYTQLAVATFFYPVVVYLAFKIFSRAPEAQTVPQAFAPQGRASQRFKGEKGGPIVERMDRVITTDIEKRAFLKLIGGVGVSYFVLSLLNRKFGALLPGGQGVAPPTADQNSNPLSRYKISEVDDNIVAYYGFTDKDSWYIMREDTTTGTFRYVKGSSNYPDNWANRENLKYDYYSNVF